MNRKELLENHDRLCDLSRDIMEKKNKDYSGENPDIFINFRSTAFIGVHPVKGILSRVLDKMQRIVTYADTGKLENDSVEADTTDIINYMILIQSMIMSDEAYDHTRAVQDPSVLNNQSTLNTFISDEIEKEME